MKMNLIFTFVLVFGTFLLSSSPIQAELQGCGEGIADRIVGGEEADPNSIPWQAALKWRTYVTPECGGTIICDKFVMTAAHCTSADPSMWKYYKVYAGEHDVKNGMDNATRHNIKKIHIHPNYRTNQSMRKWDWDYALIELSEPIQLTGDSKARAACLPDPNDKDFAEGTKFVVSGWGDLESNGWGPRKLHHVTVPAVTDAQCKRVYDITPRMHCAGNMEDGGVGSCQGDSGGPLTLVDPNTSKVKLIGVVSWGSGCAKKGYPGVYSEVTTVLEWIKDTIGYCAAQSSGCPSADWVRVKDICYLTSPECVPWLGLCSYKYAGMNWQQAQKFCNEKGGWLAEIRSSEEQTNIVNEVINKRWNNYWIGLKASAGEGQFIWNNSSKPLSGSNGSNWIPGQPDNNDKDHVGYNEKDDCVVLSKYNNWQWNDIPCRQKRHNKPSGEGGSIIALCEYRN